MKYGNTKKLNIDGLKVVYSTRDEASKRFFNHEYWFGDLFEKEVTLHMINTLRNSRCFIDVGANMGFYSILAAKMLAPNGGVVHAIEMDLENVKRIRESIKLNDVSNLVIHQLAIGNCSKMVNYYQRGSELNTLQVNVEDGHYKTVSVEMTTLDEFVEKYTVDPDVIKIDVEGAEFLVLSGMRNLLRKKDLKIYCEVHLHPGSGSLRSFGHTVDNVFSVLQQNGFHMKLLQLRRDSGYEGKNILSSGEITESSMLFAWKQ
jgi:FkbM family methyltransferase